MKNKKSLLILAVIACVTLGGTSLMAGPHGHGGWGRGCPGRPGGCWRRPCPPCRPWHPGGPCHPHHHGGWGGCHYNDFDRAIRMTEAVTGILSVLMAPAPVVVAPTPAPVVVSAPPPVQQTVVTTPAPVAAPVVYYQQ